MKKLLWLILAGLLAGAPADAATLHRKEVVLFGAAKFKPKLDLKFTAALPQVVNYTRAGSRSCFSSAGLLVTLSANTPCLDYNPTTLNAAGLLIEESRTNLLIQSQFASGWTGGNASITQAAAVGPDGVGGSAIKLVEAATTSQHLMSKVTTGTITAGQTVVVGAFLKSAERTSAWVLATDAGFANGFRINVNSTACSIIGSTAFGTGTLVANSATVTTLPNGWCWATVAGTVDPATTTTPQAAVYLNSGTSYLGDGTSGMFVYGADLQLGGFRTSYIASTAATVTRAGDLATLALTAFAFNPNAVTYVTEGDVGALTVVDAYLVGASATVAYPAPLVQGGSFKVVGALPGINYTAATNFVPTIGVVFKAAYAAKVGDHSITANGALPAISTLANAFVSPAALALGSNNSSQFLNGHLKRFRDFNSRLPDSRLPLLTSP